MVKEKPKTIKSKRLKTTMTETEPSPTDIITKEKSEALGIVEKIYKLDKNFAKAWNGFRETYDDTLESLESYKSFVEKRKAQMAALREELIHQLTFLVPQIKAKIGPQGTKHKIAYIIATNIEEARGGSSEAALAMVRRLLDRYEEVHGAIYRVSNKQKEADEDATALELKARYVDLYYDAFEKGKSEMMGLFEEVLESIVDNSFERVRIVLTNHDKVKAVQIHKREK